MSLVGYSDNARCVLESGYCFDRTCLNNFLFPTTMSSEADTSRKRARVDDPEPPAEIKPSTPYYEDGNIVLVSCAPHSSFKVHRGVLAKRSTIFRDMFGIPQPPGDGEKIDGCSVVRVSETAEELEHFLDAIYESRM